VFCGEWDWRNAMNRTSLFDWFGYNLPMKEHYFLIKQSGFDGTIIYFSMFIILGIIMGVIYARIAGYIGSILHFSDILKLLLKLIHKIRDKIKRTI
jgi:hypothetical protein